MRRLAACCVKEWHGLTRDRTALAALFLMPTVFILVLSLAMQDVFSPGKAPRFEYVVVDRDGGAAAREYLAAFAAAGRDHRVDGDLTTVREGRAKYALVIAPAFEAGLASEAPATLVEVLAAPDLSPVNLAMVQGRAADRLARMRLERWREAAAAMGAVPRAEALMGEGLVRSEYVTEGRRAPTAVQQNVPAWLIFAMFFVVTPIAGTLVAERQHGTLQRLHTLALPTSVFFAGKLLPYFVINQLQAVSMLLVGSYLVPLLGGDALTIGRSIAGLAVMMIAVSWAALGYALLVATLARTAEQASIIGGLGNVLLGAIGGIMVPKIVMPPTMQRLTDISPMAWAHEGFLRLFVLDGTVGDVLPHAAALAAFAAVCLALAGWRFHARGVA
jgi:ABC-2 type transport system permease protein